MGKHSPWQTLSDPKGKPNENSQTFRQGRNVKKKKGSKIFILAITAAEEGKQLNEDVFFEAGDVPHAWKLTGLSE